MSGPSLAVRRRLAAVIVALTIGSFMGVMGYAVWRAMRYPDRAGPLQGPTDTKVVVSKGMSLSEIAHLLGNKDLVSHPEWFRFYANERGVASKIRAGAYTLSARMTP